MVRTVSPRSGIEPNGEMNAIGLLVATFSALILLPLLLFLAVLKLVDWLGGGDR